LHGWKQQAGRLDPEEPAFIVYTSGTTGPSQGLPWSHTASISPPTRKTLVEHYPTLARKKPHRTVAYLPLLPCARSATSR